MPRYALWIVLVFAFLGWARVAKADLRWGGDAEGGAPYVFKDPKNPSANIGFEVDLAEALGKELGEKLQFTQYDYKSLLLGLERNDLDFVMNGMEETADRRNKFRFSRPYYFHALQLVTRVKEARFSDLAGAKQHGLTIATMEETAAERLLDRLGVTKKIYDGQVEPFSDLALDRVDGVLLDLPIAIYYAKSDPKLQLIGNSPEKSHYAIVFRKDQETLAKRFDDALTKLSNQGELKRIYEKWGLWNEDQLAPGTALVAPPNVTEDAAKGWTFRRYFPLLLEGAVTTVKITFASMLLAILIALPLALMRLYGPAPLRWFAAIYVEFFRGIPVLLLLYFLYFGLPVIAQNWGIPGGLKLSPIQASILGFGINYAAYEAEIYRAGIGAIQKGQWEAAASLGMGRTLAFRRIILPQAVRITLPPMTNDFVALFKDTSLVSIIAVVELSKQYQILAKSSMKYLEIGLATAMLYLAMSIPLGLLSRALERRWGQT